MSKRPLSRRNLLRGAGGLVVGLPFLEGLAPRDALGQVAAPVRRLGIFFTPAGIHPDTFFPKTAGALTPASLTGTSLEPLIGLESKFLVPRGINVPGPGGKGHQVGPLSGLTAAPVTDNGNTSVDRATFARRAVKNRPPLSLGVDAGGATPVTFTGRDMPVVPEVSPQRAFAQLMTGVTGGGVVDSVLARRQSVMDAVKADLDALKRKRLSTADKAKLDLHLTSIRELEKKLGDSELKQLTGCGLPSTRAAEIQATNQSALFPIVGKMQIDLMVLAFACGVHTEATLTWSSCASEDLRFNWDGINHPYSHHALSHHQASGAVNGNPVATAPAMLLQIEQWYCKQFRALADRLNAYTESDGKTLLDHSALIWWNEMGWGLAHTNEDQPVVIAGSAGGYLKQNQYFRMSTPRVNGQFWTTLMNAMGVREASGAPISSFGTLGGTGEIAEMKA